LSKVSTRVRRRPPACRRSLCTICAALDLLRMWHVKIEGWILEQAGIEQPGEGAATVLRAIK